MCGLCGVYGDITHQHKKVFNDLQFFSQKRGIDSTGVAVVPNNENVAPSLMKTVGDLFDWEDTFLTSLVKGQGSYRTITQADPLCLLGHHRAATIGGITEEFAQPLDYEHIIATHNGTVPKHHMREFSAYDYQKNDSQILLESLNDSYDTKTNKTPVSLLGDTRGDWALVWFNKQDRTINMARNAGRPLLIALTEDCKTLFWASEYWMLQVAFAKNKLKLLEDHVKVVPEFQFISFHVTNKNKIDVAPIEDIDKPKAVYTPPVHQTALSPGYTPHKNKPKTSRVPTVIGANQNKVVPIHKPNMKQTAYNMEYTPTVKGVLVHITDFEKLTADGCKCCNKPKPNTFSWENRDKIFWFDKDTPICEVCQEELGTDKVEQLKERNG
jgi:predicted glutamine amidotransferase